MVVYNYSEKVTLGAASSEVLIWRYTVPDGFKITILEKGFVIPDDGHIDGYLDEVKIDNLEGKAYPTMADRAVVNIELEAGQEWVFRGGSVAGGDAAVLLVYDKVRV